MFKVYFIKFINNNPALKKILIFIMSSIMPIYIFGAISGKDNPFLNKPLKEIIKASDNNNKDAQAVLGDKYAHGEGVRQDINSAISWYKKSAENGNQNAQKWLGDSFYIEGNYAEALKWFKKNAYQGDPSSQYFTAKMYSEGKGTEKDDLTAKSWFEKSALQGYGDSQYELGLIFYNGTGVKKNFKQALKWFEKSLNKQNTTYQSHVLYLIGRIYFYGEEKLKDNQKAVNNFKHSAILGNKHAQYELGQIYKNGKVAGKDHIEAYKWFILASNNGHAYASNEKRALQEILKRKEILEAQKRAHDFKMEKPSNDNIQISSGTGFFITSNGYLLTASHVVENAKYVQIKNKYGIFDAKIISANPSNDVALLKAEGVFTFINLISSRKVRLGHSAFTVGFPNINIQGVEPKFSKGEISSLSGLKDNPRHFQVSVPVQPGNSGGPLVNEHGNVIGILVSKLADQETFLMTGSIPQNVNYSVKSSVVLAFLEVWPEVIDNLMEPSGSNKNQSFQEIVKNTESSVVLIFAYK